MNLRTQQPTARFLTRLLVAFGCSFALLLDSLESNQVPGLAFHFCSISSLKHLVRTSKATCQVCLCPLWQWTQQLPARCSRLQHVPRRMTDPARQWRLLAKRRASVPGPNESSKCCARQASPAPEALKNSGPEIPSGDRVTHLTHRRYSASAFATAKSPPA